LKASARVPALWLAFFLGMRSPAPAAEPSFTLQFISVSPEEFSGLSWTSFGPFEVSAALRSAEVEPTEGPWGWSFGVTHHPLLEVLQVSIEGTNAGDLFDRQSGFLRLEIIDPQKNGGKAGYVLSTALSQGRSVHLPPNRLSTLVSATYRGSHPWVSSPTETTLEFRFNEGLVGTSSPVPNAVSYLDKVYRPTSLPLTRKLRTTPPCNVGVSLELDAAGSWREDGKRRLRVDLPAGQTMTVEVTARVSLALHGVEGPAGWSLSVKHDRPFFRLVSATTDGTDALLHADPQQRFLKTEMIDDEDGSGFISAVVLSLSSDGLRTLPVAGDFSIVRGTYQLVAPHDRLGPLPPTTVRFEDGLKGENTPPVNNIFTIDGKTEKACDKSQLQIEVNIVRGGKVFARGDASNDSRLNLSDAVWIVQALFFGGPPLTCAAAADSNGDLRLDSSDLIHLLTFLFQKGQSPPEPFPNCGPDPSLENPLGCDELDVRCP